MNYYLHRIRILIAIKRIYSPPGGLEPPTFRLTAERASRLRHGGWLHDQAQKPDSDLFRKTTCSMEKPTIENIIEISIKQQILSNLNQNI